MFLHEENNMRIKTLAAAIVLAAVSNGAFAAIANLNAEQGEIYLTVFDPSAQTSYHLDLGIDIREMFDSKSSPRSFDLSSDANFSTFIGQTDLRYTVTGTDVSFTDLDTYGFMSTARNGFDAFNKAIPHDGFINPTAIKIHDEAGVLNAQSGAPYALTQESRDIDLSAFASIGDIGYYDKPLWGDTIGNAGFLSSQFVDESVGFFQAQLDPTDGFTAINSQIGEWLLTKEGTLAYSSGVAAPAPAPVPVPAAVWLFGSGLFGLVGMARRKKA